MKRVALIAGLTGLLVVLSTGVSHAQAPAVDDPTVPDQTIVEGAGVKVGEGSVLHPVVGAETGYTTNVFYEQTGVGAPFMRLLAELNIASLSEQRIQSADPDAPVSEKSGDLTFHGGIRFIGQEYLTGDPNIDAQHNISGGANVHAWVFPQRTWRFGIDDDYIRDNRPTNFESSALINRDINHLQLQLRYAPEGRALSGAIRYQNVVDFFERTQDAFANRIQQTIGAHVEWQWLPITRLYADLSFGFFGPLGMSSVKVASNPLRGVVGIQSALTDDTAISAHVGWGAGFYSTGQSANQPIAGVTYQWRYSPTGNVVALYNYDFLDSIQANYFRDHQFSMMDTQSFYEKFVMMTIFDLRFRDYESIAIPGVTASQRSDILFDFGLSPRYYFRDWFALTIDYDLLIDSTDFRYTTDGMMVDPSYLRHQFMLGVRAAW